MLRRPSPFTDPEPLIPGICSHAEYRLGTGLDAERATGSALERRQRRRGPVETREGSDQALTMSIARRAIDDRMPRACAVQPREVFCRHAEARCPDTDESAGVAIELVAFRDALALASSTEREIVALRCLSDPAERDIADRTGAAPVAVDVTGSRVPPPGRRGVPGTLGERA